MQTLLLNPLFGAYDKGIYVFSVQVQYYALVIVCGMILAAALSALLMKRRNMDPNFVFTLFIFCIPSAIIGARLFSCLTDPALGIGALLKFPWEGLSITGGVIGGVGAGLIICLVCKVNFLRAADCVVINILFAQALGRWGNFFNGEVYGQAVTDPAMQWFPFAVPIIPGAGGVAPFSHLSAATWHYAFFFYESVINLIGWAILFTLAWRMKKKPNGILMFSYFVWYGTVRSIMEPLRDAQFILDGGGVMWSELFAILMILFGALGIASLLIINYKKEGSLVGSKNGDACGITKFLSASKEEKPYYSKLNMLGANYPARPEKEEKKEKTSSVSAPSKEPAEPSSARGNDAPESSSAPPMSESNDKEEKKS